jgi:hypothetical protein
MSPFKAFALALILNIIAVLVMERVRGLWRAGAPAFDAEALLWYAILAVTITVTQFLLVAASLHNAFPMNVAIGINIALVLTAATLNSCRTAGRWPTLPELATLAMLLIAAILLQLATTKANRAQAERQTAIADEVQ